MIRVAGYSLIIGSGVAQMSWRLLSQTNGDFGGEVVTGGAIFSALVAGICMLFRHNAARDVARDAERIEDRNQHRLELLRLIDDHKEEVATMRAEETRRTDELIAEFRRQLEKRSE